MKARELHYVTRHTYGCPVDGSLWIDVRAIAIAEGREPSPAFARFLIADLRSHFSDCLIVAKLNGITARPDSLEAVR
jgi:hypothetical protein